MKKIGLLGYGTIGRYVTKKLIEETENRIGFILDPFAKDVKDTPVPVLEDITQDDITGVDLIVEAAHADVVKKYAPQILKHTNMLIFSITSLADEEFYNQVSELCEKHNTKVYIPHGAILGLDGITDGKEIIKSVRIETIKNPKSLGRNDKEKAILYDGNARGACEAYPRNVNVHAVLALASLGFDRTQSTIISDPGVVTNSHVISVEGEGISFEIKVTSNPIGSVTGAYTPVSAYGSIKRVLVDDSGFQVV